MPQLAITSPHAFPWAVDSAAHIQRRRVSATRPENVPPPVIDLAPLHVALDSYMDEPDNPERIALVRHHLALVQAATADETLPFPWREMHYGCTLLLNADKWQPVFD
jgi:hypothetical protein